MKFSLLLRFLTPTAAVISLVFGLSPALCSGDEHPEHPKKGDAEHPKGKKESTVTLEDVAAFIEAYVQKNSKEGTYSIMDKVASKKLALTLDKVHREKLSQIGKDTYFVCADFKTAEGKVYDLDFFVNGSNKDNLKVNAEKTSIHKEEGEPRYNWEEGKGGIWKQVKVKAEKKNKEHPEHPK